jgi:CRISPR-associated protein Cas1
MLRGRLGLEKAQVPHADRHGLIYLDRGALSVQDGCLLFTSGGGVLEVGIYQLPHQTVSTIMLGPGTTVSHDALRIAARHGTALAAVGEDGTRLYTAPALGPDRSALARAQALLWANEDSRLDIARRMYAMRMGRILPHRDISVLRGIEGARVKESYKLVAESFGLAWRRRKYDRSRPEAADVANQALNHAASAVQAAAAVAVTALSALPQLGFIHEDSSQSFVLDVADLFREELTLKIAFSVAKRIEGGDDSTVDRLVRQTASAEFRRRSVIPSMMDKVKTLLTSANGEALE